MNVPLLAELAIPLGGGRRLTLAGAGNGLLWLAVGMVAIALLLVLYHYERRLTSRRAGVALLGLRLAAAAALVIALFDPIAERSYREDVRGRVIVGVDLSESMATADPGRTAEDATRLARALGLGPNESPGALTRREVARRLLGGDWLRRLQAEHDVEVAGFAREAAVGYTPELMAERLARPSRPGDPAAQVTDWGPVLGRALEGRDGAPVLGVVLLTDGRQNAPGASEPVADRLAARGIPVFPVLIGSTDPPRDVAIASVKIPERVAKGDAADVEVTLKLDGEVPGAEVPVVLERPGAEPIRKTVRRPADGARPSVTFRLPMDRVGTHPLTVSVGPAEGDVRPDNDRRSVAVEVTDDKARVLLVDGEPRWEFRYLRNALRRDPHVEVESVVFRQPPPREGAEPTYLRALPPRPDEGPDPLAAFDAIVVGDVTPEDLPEASWKRLEAYVDARGGTLVLGAGPRSWGAWAAIEPAGKLLPVTDVRPLPFDPGVLDPSHPSLPSGVVVRPAAEAEADPGSWPMLRFASEPGRSRAVWEGLPRLPWVLGGRPKPAATALASAAGEGLDAEASAVVAAMPYGLGKVLWVGTDGTWRWRHRVGDAYHHRFWGQVVRWANASKLTAGNRLVRFGPTRPRSAEGQETPIRAQFAEDAPGVGPGLLVAAKVFRARPATDNSGRPTLAPEGEAVAVVPLRPSADRPRLFQGTAPALPPGLYVVMLEVPDLAGAPTDGAPLEVAAQETPELVELAASRDALERLAAPNGGKVLAESEAAALTDLLTARSEPRMRVEASTLWDRPGSLIVFFAILTMEWALRKRAGLP